LLNRPVPYLGGIHRVHIPDGFLDTKTILATTALSGTGVAVALRHVSARVQSRRVPMIGLAAAFIFAAQMLNFPIAGGTSGHLIGAMLAAVLLGPAGGVIAMTAVLLVQCLLFADGGLLALGANIFNMAIIGTLGGYAVYRLLRRLVGGMRGLLMAAAFGSWFSTVLAASCCAGELAWSRIVDWRVAFPAMANIHMLVGVGEGIITTLVLAAIMRTRPDLLSGTEDTGRSRTDAGWIAYGLLVSIGLVLFLSPFASSWPDGLESVARALGFEQRALATPLVASPMMEYRIPGIGSPVAATMIAGAAGTILVFILSYLLGRTLVPGSLPHSPTRKI
jgi:cobalt/nickel transport system permease protein